MLDIVTGDRGEYRGDAAGAERLIDKLDSSPINCQGIIFIVKLNGNTLKTQNYYGRGNALRYEILVDFAIIKKNLINNLNDANLTWRASLVF